MQITEAARARVKSDEFLKEPAQERRALLKAEYTEKGIGLRLAFCVALALCERSFPGPASPDDSEILLFMTDENRAEVMNAAVAGIAAQLVQLNIGAGPAN